ncbi:LAETG motif-containing sortase-dependent surface protein [Streptomyces formicae]|uniref:LPXTG cell wall anchor domain-containing protein n=1 Tax=Streptomyces formicae TaxID=1616117 RepID=A0ABY3WM83_9ACTN|nr:LAETG motif-containing sortase-dependent surface protein [Streptomyces formicae]UNM13711.1 LPXTG cell wall anchor domain-containing protein [Streptomyces formicae]
MKVLTRAWKRSGALIAGAAVGFVGVGLCATPVAAHTPVWTVTCSEVTVDLTAYNDDVTNTVTITVDGKDLLPAKEFGREFHETLKLPEHKTEVPVRLVVKAGDGDRFSRDETKNSPVCETTPPSGTPEPSETPEPSGTPEPSETPSTEPPTSEPPAPSTSAPAPGDLAETGGSSATPLIAGAAVAAVLAGGGILVVTRKRRAADRG